MKVKTRSLVLCGLFIGLSFVGANLKVFGTIAFDSMPAFLGTLALGVYSGGVIGFIGHMLTALTSGFPLTLPVHFIIGVFMIITMVVYHLTHSFLENKGFSRIINLVVSCLAASLVNGPGTLLALTPIFGIEFFFSMLTPLFVVSLLNSVLGYLVYEALLKTGIMKE